MREGAIADGALPHGRASELSPPTIRTALLAALVFFACFPLGAAPPREPYEDAIDRGLAYLAKTQARDGSWGPEFADAQAPAGDPALTSLAVMAFLAAGHVPGEGKYGPVVDRGIRFVLASQQESGLIARSDAGAVEMYSHGIGTLMLAEAVGMTDEKTAAELKPRLERAVRLILRAQRTAGPNAGGWRYRLDGTDADLSVTGWQIMALRAARGVGCDVPAERIHTAVEYVRRCFGPDAAVPNRQAFGYAYTIGGNVTPACTGTGIVVLELSGKEYHRSHEALRAGAYLLRTPPDPAREHFFYGVYYTSQAMFQLGDNYWGQYRQALHRVLLRVNPPRANGAWYGRTGEGTPTDDVAYGPAYCTAMAVLALAVEYRYLPIYQRDEGETREGK